MAQVKKPQSSNKNLIGNIIAFSVFFIIVFLVVMMLTGDTETPTELSYSEFVTKVDDGTIQEFTSKPVQGEVNFGSYDLVGEDSDGSVYISVAPNENSLDELVDLSITKAVNYEAIKGETYTIWGILGIAIPIIILVAVVMMVMRNNNGNNRAFDFGKTRAKLNQAKTTTFDNVAGVDEEKQELEEIIDFLKNPKKYMVLGARIPTGILLVGPPGTGKTLLARAVAGEAGVPFYSISGSDFVEMFVGVGASRVRDMFKTAKSTAPCIVFIDEIDAVGRQRGAGLGGGHDEREQTLNQLLVEMDGFGPNSGIIVMAATNRPDVLDPALLRPGRFDRQITIGRPDIKGREAILKVHSKNKKISPKVTFEEVARRTPGFTGADLENLLNEAALLAARENKEHIKLYHIDEAVDRVMMGPAKKSRVFTKKEREFIAHHEAGHAVVGLKLDNANIVHKVTIIPRGSAGGYALMLPEKEESFLSTKQSLLDRITGLLAGRVSEELNFNEISTGAHNDFQQATGIARAMVTEYGMSALGPIQYEKRSNSVFLGRDYTSDKTFSDQVALEIDNEVRSIVNECYDRAKEVLTENLELVKLIADFLLKVETLTKEDIDEIVETGQLEWWNKKQAKAAKELDEVAVTPEEVAEEVIEEETEKTE
jgi:cell division protease FtsH